MVAEAVVRRGRQNEYDIETITIQKHTHQRLQPFISDRFCCAGRRHGRIRFEEGKQGSHTRLVGRISEGNRQAQHLARRLLRRCRRILHGKGEAIGSYRQDRWGAANLTGRRIQAEPGRQCGGDRPDKG